MIDPGSKQTSLHFAILSISIFSSEGAGLCSFGDQGICFHAGRVDHNSVNDLSQSIIRVSLKVKR